MKILLSFNVVFFLFFLSLSDDFSIDDRNGEPEAIVTTMIKICDFHPLTTGGNLPNGCNPTTLALDINDDCIGTGTATVRVTNLASVPVQNQSYNLTAGMSDIYYEYTVSGQVETIGPINSFTFKGEYAEGTNGVQYAIFEYTSSMTFDVYDDCEAGAEPVMVPFSVRLLDSDMEVYPIEEYAGINQAFCCKLFMENCNACGQPNCGGSPPVYNNLMACGVCNECSRQGGTKSENDDQLEITIARTTDEFSVQPNPFSDLLFIEYSSGAMENVAIEIFDATGKLIHFLETTDTAGKNKVNIDTDNFLNGLYFCRIKVDGEVYVHKVVKMD